MVNGDRSRNLPQEAPRFAVTPSSILDAARRLIESSRSVQDHVVATVLPENATFDNVLVPIIQAENARLLEARILCFYRHVSTSAEIRDASASANEMIEAFLIESGTREDVFALVDAVYAREKEKEGAQRLDPESEHLLNRIHGEFVRNGLKLGQGPKRQRLTEIRNLINTIGTEFAKNVSQSTTAGVWFTAEELPGLPDAVLAGMEKGTGANEGKVFATISEHYRPLLRFVTDGNSRKRMYIGRANRCNDNVPLFREATILRDEAARLLGYPSHAALSVEDKMARNTETVNSLLYNLREGLRPGGMRELGRLKALKKAELEAEGKPWDGHFFIWDQGFYSRKLLSNEYKIDHDKISEYFPLETTIKGMLEIFEQLFGLEFVELPVRPANDSENLVWHDDVQRFTVWDDKTEGGNFLGYLYLDLFSRYFKDTTPFNSNLVPGYIRPDGTRNYPATALVCSFPKPNSSDPCLLKHGDLVTVFHELGHGIHDLVSKTLYARFHGPPGTVVDFGEAPSQMLENWCITPSQLKSLSRHYSTLSSDHFNAWQEKVASERNGDGAAAATKAPDVHLPDSMMDSLVRSKKAFRALSHLNQLTLSIFDFTIHEPKDHDSMREMNITTTYNRLEREIYPMDGPWSLGEGDEWGHPYTGLVSFIAGDYHAGYYGYALAEVYSSDIFGTFFKVDPMNSKEGRRYRHELLEKGGSRPEMETLVAYLGRQPSTAAFYEQLGLA